MMFQSLHLVSAAFLASASGAGLGAFPEMVQPEVALQQVVACGFGTAQVKSDDMLQEDVIDIPSVATIGEGQLECVARASIRTSYYVIFPVPTKDAYQAIYWQLSREQAMVDARDWLAQRGLLDHLPVYDPQKSDIAAFARTLENRCGVKTAHVLKPIGEMATFDEDVLLAESMDQDSFWCLTNAATVSGYPLGFIGREVGLDNK